MLDILHRTWTRVNESALTADTGEVFYVQVGVSDEQAVSTINAWVIEQAATQLDIVVTAYLNAKVQSLGYEDFKSAAGYTASRLFGAQAQALIAWRDDVWEACINIQNAVKASQRTIPTAEQLISELPQFGG